MNIQSIELFMLLLFIVLPIIALIDILRHSFKENVNKVVWLLVIILLIPVIGPILYFIIGAKQRAIN